MAKKKTSDYDYLHANARIWEMERRLFKADLLDRMIDYAADEDILKTLGEYGYEVSSLSGSSGNLEAAISGSRARVFDEIATMIPDKGIIDFFKVKYDYHNIKAATKGALSGDDLSRIMVESGRFGSRAVRESVVRDDQGPLSDAAFSAAAEAKNILARTEDAQTADLALDRAMYGEMLDLAKDTGSDFLAGYVRLMIDTANLRTLVRSVMMGKDAEFVRFSLVKGGNIDPDYLVSLGDITAPLNDGLYDATPLEAAAFEGLLAIRRALSLTRFEKLCDDAMTAYLKKAHMLSFGEAPLIAFIAAKEAEAVAIRTIVSGRLAGVPGNEIRERLRTTYV